MDVAVIVIVVFVVLLLVALVLLRLCHKFKCCQCLDWDSDSSDTDSECADRDSLSNAGLENPNDVITEDDELQCGSDPDEMDLYYDEYTRRQHHIRYDFEGERYVVNKLQESLL